MLRIYVVILKHTEIMKKTLLLLCICTAGMVWSQNTANQSTENQERISEIQNELNESVAAENYEKAADLKKELEIREDIQAARVQNDEDRVQKLKKKLKKVNKKSCFCDMKKNYDPKKKFSFYVDMAPLGYIYSKETEYGVPSNEITPTQTEVVNHQFSFGKTIGSSFYFGDMDKDFKVGFDLIYMTLLASNSSFDFSTTDFKLNFAQPGIVFTKYFSNGISGMDYKANVGVNRNRSVNENGFWGANAVGQVKYWKHGMSIGLIYQYGMGLEHDFDYHHVGMTFGIRL